MPLPSTPHLGKDMTGRPRFRRGWFGRLILQFEEPARTDPAMPATATRWHDCKERDLWRLRAHREQRSIEPLI